MAVSIVDPPPTATNASNSPARANAIASRKDSSLGSTRTRSYSVKGTRLCSRDSSAVCTGGSDLNTGSVSTRACLTPSAARSIPTSRVTPKPKRTVEAAISKALSLSIE